MKYNMIQMSIHHISYINLIYSIQYILFKDEKTTSNVMGFLYYMEDTPKARVCDGVTGLPCSVL